MTQLPLFSAEMEAERTLKEKYDLLAAYYRDAEARLEKARIEFRTLREERDSLREALVAREQRYIDLQRVHTAALGNVEFWRGQCEFWRDQYSKASAPPYPRYTAAPTHALAPILKQLLFLAHPDRWSQGQPAVELAHELAIAINTLREEGRP